MSSAFRVVNWNRDKIIYDVAMFIGVAIYFAFFSAIYSHLRPPDDFSDIIEIGTLATGSCVFFLLSFILAIGPLARLNRKFLPLLYNRRHLGVLTFVIAIAHLCLTLTWSGMHGKLPDLFGKILSLSSYMKFIGFPYETLGLIALLIMFLMAATSHDFWTHFLKPPAWKALHMALYVAYGLVVMHVALGIMQFDRTALIPITLLIGFSAVSFLHVLAGWKEYRRDKADPQTDDGWILVGPPDSFIDKAARIVTSPSGERIAVFRDGKEFGALTNLCAHQNGPLGEGRIIDGCVTCPWHGYQYRLADGCAPAPYTDKIETFRVRVNRGVIEVHPTPLPPGTRAPLMNSPHSI